MKNIQLRVVGELVPKALIPTDWPVPGVLLWSTGRFNWHEESLANALRSCFPDVDGSRDEYLYPCPGQPRFWAEYAELLSDFVIWAKNFHDVVMAVSGFGLAEQKEPRDARVNDAMYWLESLASSVSTSIEFEIGTKRFLKRWQSLSLLSSFAMMAIEDMATGQRVRICEECGNVFCKDRAILRCDNCRSQGS